MTIKNIITVPDEILKKKSEIVEKVLSIMEIYKPIEFNDMRNDKNFRNETTLKINKIMEDMIKKNPHQWIWTHDRWK